MPPQVAWREEAAQILLNHYAQIIVAVDGAGDPETPLELLRDHPTATRLRTMAAQQAAMFVGRLNRVLDAALKDALSELGTGLDAVLTRLKAADESSASTGPGRRLAVKRSRPDAVLEVKTGKVKWSTVLVGAIRNAWRAIKPSIGSASNVNTQGPAEEAEADGLVDVVPNDAGAPIWHKRWLSMEDKKVRPAHRAAHGQVVPIESAFSVGGEALRFPGDMQLGASLGNVINCRCISEYGIIEDGKFVPVGNVSTPRLPARPVRRPGTRPGSAAPRVPTTAFTFATGNARRRLILSTGEDAHATVANGAVTIRVNRRVVASAPLKQDRATGKFTLGPVRVAESHRGVDFDTLLRASTEATNALRTPHR